MNYISLNDPTGLVIIQSGLNFPVFAGTEENEKFELLTYVKAPQICKKNINRELNNINSVRFLLSCATGKKFHPNKSDES